MQGKLVHRDIKLDCSVDRFTDNGIPKQDAIVLLNHLHHCLGGSNFKLELITENVFNNGNTKGFEEGNIFYQVNPSVWEPAKRVEDGGICMAFLFFSNVMDTTLWMPVPRRGKGYDYTCYDSQGRKIVVEVGGRTSKYGARTDLKKKIARFHVLGKISESIFISSVGFYEGEHIVHRYN